MKKIFTLSFALIACAGTIFAEKVQIGDLYYNLNAASHMAEVTSQNSHDPYWSTSISEANIPQSVTFNSVTYNVTSIGKSAFWGCSSLTNVIIPNSVTSIGDYAFAWCKGLTSVTIPNSVTSIGEDAFSNCSALTNVTIPNSIRSIGGAAFWGCTGLTNLTIPNTASSIGNYAFYHVANIIYSGKATGSPWEARSVNGYVEGWLVYSDETKSSLLACSSSASGEITIPNSVTSIGDWAFDGCSSLTSVTIPNSVTSIGKYAFDGCSGLTSVTIGNSVTSIRERTFDRCTSLTSVTIGNSVTSIGENAFSDCSALTNVTIPNSVTSIGDHAFAWCESLTNVTIPNSVTSIGEYAFAWCDILTNVTIPNSVTSIGEGAFSMVSNIIYSGSATGSPWGARCVNGYIEGWFVYSDETKSTLLACSSSASGEITIPSSVTSIGEYAFSSCTGLTNVTIPNSVTSIGEYAFGMVSNIVYSGSATGSPWGARCVNGYVEGLLVYSDETKSTLLACYPSASGEITIPNSVTSIGDWAFYDCSSLTNVAIPSSVTSIGEGAFSGCIGLTNVTIPNSVTSIGRWTFDGCKGLTNMTIPNSVTSIGDHAFYYCSNLTSVTIPNSVTSIGESAFSGCEGLTSVTIPSSITSIGEYAFSSCEGLTSVYISDIAAWCRIAFSNSYSNPLHNAEHLYLDDTIITDLVIPYGVTSIGNYAFYYCSDLTSVTIPNSVTSIGEYAFYYCPNLTSVTISDSVTRIGSYAFDGCSGLTSVTIPNSVTSIGTYAFEGCTGLTSVTIPSSVTSIGRYAFYNVPSIIYSGSATGSPWGARSVNGYVDGWLVYSDQTKSKILACSTAASGVINIPNSVTSIGDRAFQECSSLTSITIPEGVLNTGRFPFNGCSGLTSVTWNAVKCTTHDDGEYVYPPFQNCLNITSFVIGNDVEELPRGLCYGLPITTIEISNNVTSIGTSAFRECFDLTSVTIPSSVTSIAGAAFYDCFGLANITSKAVVPPTCSNSAFEGVDKSIPLYVPTASMPAYQTANVWKEFYNIQEIDTENIDQIIENQSQWQGHKLIVNGQILIKHGDHIYTVTGQEVK